MALPKFELVDDQVEAPRPAVPAPTKTSAVDWGALQLLGIALTALSQRALVALSACFNMALVGSAFALWYLTPDPNPHQITSLGMYAAFVLAAIYLNRRK